MKHVDVVALEKVSTPIIVKMDRKAKLLHWAGLIRNFNGGSLALFHNLEFCSEFTLKALTHSYPGVSAFTLAFGDKVLQDQGHTSPTIYGAMKFFELSKRDLHEFSCDCGGAVTNKTMADRIEHLANNPGAAPTFNPAQAARPGFMGALRSALF